MELRGYTLANSVAQNMGVKMPRKSMTREETIGHRAAVGENAIASLIKGMSYYKAESGKSALEYIATDNQTPKVMAKILLDAQIILSQLRVAYGNEDLANTEIDF